MNQSVTFKPTSKNTEEVNEFIHDNNLDAMVVATKGAPGGLVVFYDIRPDLFLLFKLTFGGVA